MLFLFLLLFGFQINHIAVDNCPYEQFYKVGKLQRQPVQKYTWTGPPDVRVCENTGVSLLRVRNALKYWERLGYEFGDVYLDRLSYCMNPKDQEIAIVLPSQGVIGDKMAATRVYSSRLTGEILKAKIFVLPKTVNKERLLEHEIGHALGWSHYNSRGHIMHPNWWQGGFNSYGLRKK